MSDSGDTGDTAPASPYELPKTGEKLFVAGLSFALFLIFSIALASLFAIVRLQEDHVWVAQGHKMIGTLESILAIATDAETAGRGYAITGDPAYLEPYADASRKLAAVFQELKALVADDPQQAEGLNILAGQVERRMGLVEELIQKRQWAGPAAARAFILSGQGKRAHDAIRRQISEMRQREEASLNARLAETGRGSLAAISSVIFGSVLAISAIGCALYFIRRDYSGSRQAHAALREANNELDRRVAERTAALQKANEHLKLAEAVFQHTQEKIVITDPGCNIVAVNPAFTKITEYTAEEAVGKHVRLIASGRHDRSFYLHMWQSIQATGRWQGEIWNRRKSGDFYKEWLAISSVRGPQGELAYYIGVGADMTRMNRVETELEYLAQHDPLTGLPNRLLLISRLEHTLERAKRDKLLCAVMFLDLDRFKAVNDTLGHAAGDELLRQAAARMNQRLREVDTLARLGGDEFVIVLEGIKTPEDAGQLAGQVIDRLRRPFILGEEREACIGASIGIGIYPWDADDPAELLKKADQALYAAKQAGRGTWRQAGREGDDMPPLRNVYAGIRQGPQAKDRMNTLNAPPGPEMRRHSPDR